MPGREDLDAWEGRLGCLGGKAGMPGREGWDAWEGRLGCLGGKAGSACEEFEDSEGGV